jgi:hypothetical protein
LAAPVKPYAFINRVVHGGNVQEANGMLVVETPLAQWAYAVEVPLCRDGLDNNRALRLSFEISVDCGRLGTGILSRDGRIFRHELQIAPADGEYCEFIIGPVRSIGSLIIRNTSPTGVSRGKFRILGVDEILSSDVFHERTPRPVTA